LATKQPPDTSTTTAKANAPDYRMGLIYDGFVVTPTEELPDRDQSKWQLGLDGKPADPHVHTIWSQELFTYCASNVTSRRAMGNLLRHYNRMRVTAPDFYPVVRMKVGGFNHRDERVGWVSVPVFQIVGRQPKDSTTQPDTSLAADMGGDSIPF
jgi:hypothetical protein